MLGTLQYTLISEGRGVSQQGNMAITMKLDNVLRRRRHVAISLVVQVIAPIAIPSPAGMINIAWLAEGARARRKLPSN
jgi:hypothetical protein